MLTALLAVSAVCSQPPPAPPVLADEPCDSAFDLVVASDLVRSRSGTGLLVLMNVGDSGDSLEFVLRPNGCQIRRRQSGRETVLAGGRAPRLRADHIVIKRRPGNVAVAYGATTIARAPTGGPGGGRWGLAEGTAQELEQLSYQPIGDIVLTDDFMRGPDEEGQWTNAEGEWKVRALDSAEFSANAFCLAGRQNGRRPALTVAGDWFWEDYTVTVSARPSVEAQGFGVGLCYQEGPSVCLLRAERAEKGPVPFFRPFRLQLVRIDQGRERILAETAVSLRPDEWRRLTLSAANGELVGEVDGERLLTADDPTLAQGQAALWVGGGSPVYFDDVEVHGGPPRARPPTVLAHAKEAADPAAARFITDHYMEGWADESDQWAVGAGPSIWHAGVFWGDVELAWDATPAALASPAELHIAIPVEGLAASPPARFEAGYHLRVAPQGGRLSLTLARGSEARATGEVLLSSGGARIALRRTGHRVDAVVNDQKVASFEDEVPLGGGKVGLSGAGVASQAPTLSIASTNVLDSTFRSAPVEWAIGSGTWGVESRWACTPRWSWFGGRSQGLAAIWTRDSFLGDLVVDFFASIPMDSPFAPFYQHPSNIGVTLCSDGRTLGTGYSLIYAAWEDRATAIFRRGEVVAQTPDFRLPDILDTLGGTFTPDAAGDLHKSWRHIRAERFGQTVRLLIDGRLALSYDDPAPLPGGPVCLWTLDNGIMVARARVYYETAGRRSQEAGAWMTATAGCGAEKRRTAVPVRCPPSPVPCLSVVNPVSGGDFAWGVAAARGVDVRRRPVMTFDYAIPADVKIDVYLTTAGQRYRLRLTGPEEGANGIEELGALPDAAGDGEWHHAKVDLLERLAPLRPGGAPIVLDGLEFANHAQKEYLAVGVGGNGTGATYRLARIELLPRAKRRQVHRQTPDTASDTLPQKGTLPARPPVRCDFETDLGRFRPWGLDSGTELRRAHTPVEGNEVGGEWCLEIRNAQLGGLFGVEVDCVPFEASRYQIVSFDYRVPDTLRVDLIEEIAGVRRTIKFTDNDATWPVIGTINAIADSRWHRAVVDLGRMLREAFPGRRALPVTRLAFASSGWPGNRKGTTYWLDNFAVAAAPSRSLEDHTPPAFGRPTPGPGDRAATRTISVTVTDEGSGASPADLRLRVGEATYTLADEAIRFDETSGCLTWTAPGGAPLGRDGEEVTCELRATDLAGNEAPPFSWTWALTYGQDDRPPPAPVVSYLPSEALFTDTFESGKGGWGDFLSCQVLRRDSGGATGPGCIELRELGTQSPGFALLRDIPPDWTRCPVLRFQYRGEGTGGASIVLYGTTFDGVTDYWTPLGSFSVSDAAWRTASVDLLAALKAANPALTMHRLFLAVRIPQPEGTVLIDDAVMYSPTGTSARFAWSQPPDASGISGYSWQLDHEEGSVPDEVVDGAHCDVGFSHLAPGRWWFHLRARDGAGQWGPGAHVAFAVTAPSGP